MVISKDAVGNSGDILNAILGHKYGVLKSIKHVHLANEGKISTKVSLIFRTDCRFKKVSQSKLAYRTIECFADISTKEACTSLLETD